MRHDLRSFCTRSLAALALIGLYAPASPAAQGGPQAPRWQVDWGDRYCSLARTGAGTAPSFAVRIIPGTDSPEILFAVPRGAQPRVSEGSAAVALAPSGDRFDVTVAMGRIGDERAVILKGLDLYALRRLAAATGFQVTQDDQVRDRAAFAGAQGAVTALQQCIDSVLAEWGVDAARLASLRQWPESRQAWASADDYPARALRDGINGTALVRVAIDATGRVTECAVVVSTGNAELDRASCASATQRGRYSPAIGPEGTPVPVAFISDVRWSIWDA